MTEDNLYMIDKELNYTAHDYTVAISTNEYIRRFRDSERFIKYCRECKNFNRSWACPPFSHDTEAELRKYSSLLLIATRIDLAGKEIPIAESPRLIRPERIRIERRLLEMERIYGGRSYAYAGSCLYCPENTCARTIGKPCRHPDLVRPSLEAYGFDIGRTTAELFGIPLLWGKDGILPDYLTLVCGFFHNSENVIF